MPYKKAYQEALLEARKAALSSDGIPKKAYELLIQVFGQAIVDIDRDIGRRVITSQRAEALRRQINQRIIELGQRLGIILDNQKSTMIQAAISGHEQGIARAIEITGVSVAVNFNGIPDQALRSMMLRRGLFGVENYRTIINRKLQGVAKDIERYIGSAITRGVSARRSSEELAGMLSQGNDDILRYVQDGRLTRSAVRDALKSGELDIDQYREAKKIFYDSQRIMVTETNTAFTEAELLSQKQSPIVGATRWQVSSRHYGLSTSPCTCTMYHEADLFGLGAGVFPTDNYPAKPHPFCGCYPTAILRDVSEWNSPKNLLEAPPSLSEDRFKELYKDATPRKLESHTEIANKYLQLAYEFARESAAA